MRRGRLWLALGTLLALAARAAVGRTTAAAADERVRVRADSALAACLSPALDAFTGSSGSPILLSVAEPDPPEDADLVVGDDLEMTRLLESGAADLSTAFDLGELPWVLVVPEGAPAGSLGALANDSVAVLGGGAGREARAALGAGAIARGRLDVTTDAAALGRARYALVPRSLAGPGEHRPAGVRALVATAAVMTASPRRAATHRLLAFLAGEKGARALAGCLAPSSSAAAGPPRASGAAVYAQRVVDWWLPQCSLVHNRYNDPEDVLGRPDAVSLTGPENYRGFMSLGQGGYVTVDLGVPAVDGNGPDIRVFQTVTGEAVTLYASTAPDGPFTLVGLRVPCGVRTPGVYSNHCDFDLRDAGLASARYLKVEDGEIFPCLAGGTYTEGADIDAVEALN
jgi:hypothetical protein